MGPAPNGNWGYLPAFRSSMLDYILCRCSDSDPRPISNRQSDPIVSTRFGSVGSGGLGWPFIPTLFWAVSISPPVLNLYEAGRLAIVLLLFMVNTWEPWF